MSTDFENAVLKKIMIKFLYVNNISILYKSTKYLQYTEKYNCKNLKIVLAVVECDFNKFGQNISSINI